jgi:hypothetical protein
MHPILLIVFISALPVSARQPELIFNFPIGNANAIKLLYPCDKLPHRRRAKAASALPNARLLPIPS